MANGIEIIGRDWVADPTAPGGRKEVVTYALEDETLIDDVLVEYPYTGTGSCAVVFETGFFKCLFPSGWR